MSPTQARSLLHDWRFWARPEQVAPPGDWFCWLILSGRGFGKTRSGAEWVLERARSGKCSRIALVGQTAADVRDIMVEVGESSIIRCAGGWCPVYEPTKRRLTFPNGCMALTYSGDDPDQLRGPQHDSCWMDELAKFRYPEECWSNMTFGLRLGDPRVCVTTTPRPIPLIKRLMENPSTAVVRGSSYRNRGNLAEVFFREVIDPLAGTRLGRQEIEGEILEDTPGALWNRTLLDRVRKRSAPALIRLVVGVDPAATKTSESNETGIIAAGVGEDGHGYVLDDLSLKGSPHEWGSRAVEGFRRYSADRVVVEVNQGGDMVAHTLRTIDKTIPIREVRATRGKLTRAEPVAALYEQGRIHHVGCLPLLEDQMCSWVPGEASPDRMDALVWAMTDLMLGGREGTGIYA